MSPPSNCLGQGACEKCEPSRPEVKVACARGALRSKDEQDPGSQPRRTRTVAWHCNACNPWPWGARRSKPPKPPQGTNRDKTPPGAPGLVRAGEGRTPRSSLLLAVRTTAKLHRGDGGHSARGPSQPASSPSDLRTFHSKVDGIVSLQWVAVSAPGSEA